MAFLYEYFVFVLHLLQFQLSLLIHLFQLVFIHLINFREEVILVKWWLGNWSAHWLLVVVPLDSWRDMYFIRSELFVLLFEKLAVGCFNFGVYHF